jgi:hypothetical protein
LSLKFRHSGVSQTFLFEKPERVMIAHALRLQLSYLSGTVL